MAKPVRFIILIPHRDAGRLISAYQTRLFAAGLSGAYSFPAAAPLGVVSRPFTRAELKTLAHSVRALSAGDGRDGKITLGERDSLLCPPEVFSLSLFGLRLDLPPPDFPRDSVRYRFPSLVLCAGLITAADRSLIEQDSLPSRPSCFFRAAMIANMILRPLPSGAAGYSFEWKIGAPVWLPAYKRE